MKSQHLNIKIFFSLSKGSSDDFKVNYAEKEIGARVSESSRKWYDHDYDASYSESYSIMVPSGSDTRQTLSSSI